MVAVVKTKDWRSKNEDAQRRIRGESVPEDSKPLPYRLVVEYPEDPTSPPFLRCSVCGTDELELVGASHVDGRSGVFFTCVCGARFVTQFRVEEKVWVEIVVLSEPGATIEET